MCMCMYGHTYIKSMDQSGDKVANPARGQLNRDDIEYFIFPCPRSRLRI